MEAIVRTVTIGGRRQRRNQPTWADCSGLLAGGVGCPDRSACDEFKRTRFQHHNSGGKCVEYSIPLKDESSEPLGGRVTSNAGAIPVKSDSNRMNSFHSNEDLDQSNVAIVQ